ncbi:NAD(P)/FAD-dependent oxidoreductase [Ureibacillus sp. 179-F W5.1 NHS]|uniref:Ferredoxin--NADP reductase n=1 Tax=Lysinibacillus halotolerans TaxID=1368476 RepID=A0A3M8H6Z1_9BACI|nr:NAD(P)/FAD-dependent oxidoreductase [Lysinibacillus halotolerans]RNC98188.1 NAD(P)/FAD-dependent oxidoreductase [Lysinibacillus halotolerans]
MSEIFDVTIIGGGPAGLYSTFYSGLRNMKTKLIESQAQLGGKVLLYPEKMIWDVGGQPPIMGAQFVIQLIEQAKTFQPTILTNTKVDFIDKNDNNLFIISTNDGQKHYSKSIIMANGGGIYNPQKLDIEGAEKFEMTNLHYTVPSFKLFQHKRVLISGGGNGAIDWAVEMLDIADEIIVVYRKDQLTAHEAQVALLQSNPKVTILLNTTIEKLIANKEKTKVSEVVLKKHDTVEELYQPIDHIIVSHGYNRDASLQFSDETSLKLKDDYYYEGTATGKTSKEGIFAAGDILSYEGKVNLLVGTFQDAVNAVNSAKVYIDPLANKFEMVSSHNEKFQEKNRQIIQEMLVEK